MLSARILKSTARPARALAPKQVPLSVLVQSSVPAARRMCTAAEAPAGDDTKSEGGVVARFGTTAEVIVSKIFPAGFGWQAASCFAGTAGFEADTLNFALTTGAGDFAGVLAGHTTFSLLKAAFGGDVKIGSEFVTGLWLATAAFCSGTAWQPVVNFLHDSAGCNFAQTVVGCGAATGFSFFVGLRLGRIVYAPLGLPGQDYDNLGADAYLSASIGAATGTFVGTDITFADNVIRPAFGVEDSMSDLEGMVRAGMSTSTGFLCLQSIQNVTMPKNTGWIRP